MSTISATSYRARSCPGKLPFRSHSSAATHHSLLRLSPRGTLPLHLGCYVYLLEISNDDVDGVQITPNVEFSSGAISRVLFDNVRRLFSYFAVSKRRSIGTRAGESAEITTHSVQYRAFLVPRKGKRGQARSPDRCN